jgi:hypothetical protein
MFGVGRRGAGPRSAIWGRGSAASAYPVAGPSRRGPRSLGGPTCTPSPSAADKQTTIHLHQRLVPYFDPTFSSLYQTGFGGIPSFASLDSPFLPPASPLRLAFVSPARVPAPVSPPPRRPLSRLRLDRRRAVFRFLASTSPPATATHNSHVVPRWRRMLDGGQPAQPVHKTRPGRQEPTT